MSQIASAPDVCLQLLVLAVWVSLCPDVSFLVFFWESHMLSPLFSLCPCDLTRMEPLCEGTFLCVVSLYRLWAPLPGNMQGCRADLDRERETWVPKEREAGATEQDLRFPCSAPHMQEPPLPTQTSKAPSTQELLAGACFLQGFPWSRSPLSLPANV